MHEDPQIPNFVSSYRGPELREGMTLAIEPMITAGDAEVFLHDDDWSISTDDGSLAAHFEHTVAVTAGGPLVLTTEAPVWYHDAPRREGDPHAVPLYGVEGRRPKDCES